jgi:hypothetical protein
VCFNDTHFNICKEIGVKLDKEHRYEHVPKSVETSHKGKVTILWSQHVQTDRTIRNYKLDIIIQGNEEGTGMLIDVAISEDRNVFKKEDKKFIIQRLYNRNTAHVECKNKSDTNNNRGNWNHVKIIQKIPEPHTGKA